MSELLYAAREALKAGPLRFGDLIKRLVEAGKIRDDKKEHAAFYRVVNKDIKSEENPYFVAAGGFKIGANPKWDPLKVPEPVVKEENESKKRRRESREFTDRRCGTCTHCSWNGIQEIAQRDGVCDVYETSGRLSVYSGSPPCDQWSLKPAGTRGRERDEQLKGLELIREVNKQVQRGRRGGKLVTVKTDEKGNVIGFEDVEDD
jgi:hypothetical protein